MSSLKMFTVEGILEATRGKLVSGSLKTEVAGISIDSRQILPGELFVAIKGKNFDGHDFVGETLRKGAAGAVISKGSVISAAPGAHEQVIVQVNETVKALGDLAYLYRERFELPMIGITGSNGKTTTKDMVASILARRYATLKSEASFNNLIGVPLTLFKLTDQHEVCVVELGTSQLGEISRLSRIAEPSHGIITNVGPSHLEFFGDIHTVYRAKAELLEVLGRDGVAILNGDDQRLLLLAKGLGIKPITFGVGKSCDFRANHISYLTDGLNFRLNGSYPIELRLLGRHNVYNALASIAIASTLGLDYDLAREALLTFRPPRGRMEVSELNGIRIIDDTYNSNPQSLGCAIEALSKLSSRGRKILVSGDMLEQGVGARLRHFRMGQKAARAGIDLLVCVGQFSKDIARGALRYGMSEADIFEFASQEEVARWLLKTVVEGDTMLVKGSRATRMERVIDSFENFYSRKIASSVSGAKRGI